MNLDLLIFVLALSATVNYRFRRSVLYPPFLFCGMWLVVTVLLRMNIVEMYPLHTITLNYVAAGAILFSVGGYFAFFVPRILVATRFSIFPGGATEQADRERPKRRVKWRNFAIVSALLITVGIEFHLMHQLAAQSNIEGGLLARAESADVENTANGSGSLLEELDIPLLTVFFAVLYLQKHSGRMAAIVMGLVLANCILRGSRGALLILFSALLAVQLMDRKQERMLSALKATRLPIVFFVVLFGGLVIFKKNTSGVEGNLVGFAGNALVQYIVGPLGALDHVLTHPSDYVALSNHTFKLFLKMASMVGLISYTPPPGNEWIFVPFGANVYTAYEPFITDFGLYGALGIFSFIGFMHTLLFRRAKLGGRFAQFMFALSVYPIIMVVFDDVYTAFLLYIEGMLFAMLYLTIRRMRLLSSTHRPEYSVGDVQRSV